VSASRVGHCVTSLSRAATRNAMERERRTDRGSGAEGSSLR
jgi:hypothetical protein